MADSRLSHLAMMLCQQVPAGDHKCLPSSNMTPVRECRKFTIRIYDPALIAWLDTLPSSYGAKSQAIAAALKRGLAGAEAQPSARVELDLETILPDIRQVVEAAITSTLGSIQIVGTQPVGDLEEPDEVEALLARFDHSLMLDEDDA